MAAEQAGAVEAAAEAVAAAAVADLAALRNKVQHQLAASAELNASTWESRSTSQNFSSNSQPPPPPPPPLPPPPGNSSAAGAGGGGGTPGWQTGLLTVLVSTAIILAIVTMFALITRRMRSTRRRVLAALARIQEAELADMQAADLEAARRWHAAAVARADAQRGQHAQHAQHGAQPRPTGTPPVVVIQPDLGVGLCSRCQVSTPGGGGGSSSGKSEGGGGGGGEGSSSAGSSAAAAAAGVARDSAGAAGMLPGAASAGQRGAVAPSQAASAAAAEAAGGAVAVPPPRLPMQLQRFAFEFPGLGAAVLLLLPHHAGWVVLRAGAGAPALLAPAHLPPPMSIVEVGPLTFPEDEGGNEVGAEPGPEAARSEGGGQAGRQGQQAQQQGERPQEE